MSRESVDSMGGLGPRHALENETQVTMARAPQQACGAACSSMPAPRLCIGSLARVWSLIFAGAVCPSAAGQSQLVAWGDNIYGQVSSVPSPPPGLEYVQIAAGYAHGLAVLSDGTAVGWGNNLDLKTIVPPLPPGTTHRQVTAGWFHSVLLRSDGQLVGWGWQFYGQTFVPALPPGTTYTQVDAGAFHSVAVRSDGALVAWGDNSFGQCNVPTLPTGVMAIQVQGGDLYSAALLSDGSIVVWGSLGCGSSCFPALPPGVRYIQISAGASHFVALRSDGIAVAFGENSSGESTLPGLPSGLSYTSLAAGNAFTLLRRSDGSVIAVGKNDHGQCAVPAAPTGLAYVEVAAGGQFGLGRLGPATGSFSGYCFGDGLSSPCPCGNSSNLATGEGCRHSGGEGAKLTGTGLPQVSSDSARLELANLPIPPTTPNFVLFFQGTTPRQTPFMDGLLCVGGDDMIRLGIKSFAGDSASLGSPPDTNLSTLGLIPGTGGVRYYQAWYRDTALPCGSRSNLSNGISVTWAP